MAAAQHKFQLDTNMEDWVFPTTGEFLSRRALLTIGKSMVAVDNIFSKRFDLEQSGYSVAEIKAGLSKTTFDMGDVEEKPQASRGPITDFTRASQQRFQRAVSMWEPVGKILFVTLTYPRSWPDPETRRAQFKRFRERMLKDLPHVAGCWKLEYQRRGAPHYHWVIQTGSECPDPKKYQQWVQKTWDSCIGAHGICRVEVPRSDKKAKFYLTKEMGKMVQSSKAERLKCDNVIEHVGRFWGWHNRKELQQVGDYFTLPSEMALLVRSAIQSFVLDGMERDGVITKGVDGVHRFNRDQREVDPDMLPSWRMFEDGQYAWGLICERVFERDGVKLNDHCQPLYDTTPPD